MKSQFVKNVCEEYEEHQYALTCFRGGEIFFIKLLKVASRDVPLCRRGSLFERKCISDAKSDSQCIELKLEVPCFAHAALIFVATKSCRFVYVYFKIS